MHALKTEEIFSYNLAESNNEPYTLTLDNFGESNDQIADQITTLSGQINAANYQFLKLIAEFDRRQAWEGLPGINTAFQKGELSFSKVRAMTRVATEENEAYLLNIAEYDTAQHMEVLVKAFRTVSRIADTAEDFNAVEGHHIKHWADGGETKLDNLVMLCTALVTRGSQRTA